MHELLPWFRMLLFAAFGIVAMTVLVPGISLVRETGAHDWHATGKLTLEEVKLAIGFGEFTKIEYRTVDGRTRTMSRYGYVTFGPAISVREDLLALIGDRATLGAAAGFGAAVLYLALYGFTGWWRDPPASPPAHRPPSRPVRPAAGAWSACGRFARSFRAWIGFPAAAEAIDGRPGMDNLAEPAGTGRKAVTGQFATRTARAAVPASGQAPTPANGGSGRNAATAPPRSETAPGRGNSTPPVPAPAKRGGTRAAAKPRPASAEKPASKQARVNSNTGNRKPDRRRADPDQNFY